jgi:carbamoyltransferase
MNKNGPTLAIYGIQDRKNYEHSFYVHDHNLALMQNGNVISFIQLEPISRKNVINAASKMKPDGVVINGMYRQLI